MKLEYVRNGVVVVAHPDDESLWCGGLLARFPCFWTVICCSIPRADPIRAFKFFDACGVLRAEGRLLPFVEPNPTEEMTKLDMLDLGGYDAVVTHNAVGEYGNRQHIDVHRYVTARYPNKTWTIGYGDSEGSERITLSDLEKIGKHNAIASYNHTSPFDGKPKWRALLARYGKRFDLGVETYAKFRP